MTINVPDALVRDALDLAPDVIALNLKSDTASRILAQRYGIKAGTCAAHVVWACSLRTGQRIRRTASAQAVRIMVERIAADGPEALFVALDTLWEHIAYRNKPQRDLRALHEEFAAQLLAVDIELGVTHELEHAVRRSLADPSEARARRLANASVRPEQMLVVTRVFRRNPDVIAAVLVRANGVCEGCRQPAPFARADGSLYLEVHHMKRLADGGDDSVENAHALCPNCHRERHFGAAYDHGSENRRRSRKPS